MGAPEPVPGELLEAWQMYSLMSASVIRAMSPDEYDALPGRIIVDIELIASVVAEVRAAARGN